MSVLNRRDFVHHHVVAAAVAAMGWSVRASGEDVPTKTTQIDGKGYFSVTRHNDRWWIVEPHGEPTFLLGLNHIDPGPLRDGTDDRLWQRSYAGEVDRWLQQSVYKNLVDWGFNCVGLSSGIVAIEDNQPQLGGGLSIAELQTLGMPFGYLLPFHSIDPVSGETPPLDYRSQAFVRWCDRVASQHCTVLKDDVNLIGYWSADRPDWKRLSAAGTNALSQQASAYYQTIHQAIRRYDPHHIILGDRYDANRWLSATVVRAAVPHVDVLSVNCSGDVSNVHRQLTPMARMFDRPILVSDHATDRQPHDGLSPPQNNRYHDPRGYGRTIQMLTGLPQIVGYQLSGGYLPGPVQRRGLLDAQERPDTLAISGIRSANAAVAKWNRETVSNRQ